MTLLNVVWRAALGIIVAIIAYFAIMMAWLLGSPPMISLAWPSVQAEVTRYALEPDKPADDTYPVLRVEGIDEPVRFITSDSLGREARMAAYPVGAVQRVKVDRSLAWAYPAQKPPALVFALAITIMALVFTVIANGWWIMRLLGPRRSVTALYLGTAALMLVFPAVVAAGFWTMGEPPAATLFGAKEKVRVESLQIRPLNPDDPRSDTIPEVRVSTATQTPPQTLSGLSVYSASDRNRLERRFAPGTEHTVVRHEGRLYLSGWTQHWGPMFAALLVPLMAWFALSLIWQALRPARTERPPPSRRNRP